MSVYDTWVLIGVLVSFGFGELTGISPGGIIVPVYLALNLTEPRRVAATLIVSLLTFGLVRLSERWLILYGRRKFVLAVCLSILLASLLRAIPGARLYVDVIGCLVPGILAREMDRQGVGKTLLALVAVVGILAMLLQQAGIL